jgi:hypothetical protein
LKKKRWVYVVHDPVGIISHHKTLESAMKRGEGRWRQIDTAEDEPRKWIAGRLEEYHVTITEVRLWD